MRSLFSSLFILSLLVPRPSFSQVGPPPPNAIQKKKQEALKEGEIMTLDSHGNTIRRIPGKGGGSSSDVEVNYEDEVFNSSSGSGSGSGNSHSSSSNGSSSRSGSSYNLTPAERKAREDRLKAQCLNYFANEIQKPELEKATKACTIENVYEAIEAEGIQTWKVVKRNYTKCLQKMEAEQPGFNDYVEDCAHPDKHTALMLEEFPGCLVETKKRYGNKIEAYDKCTSRSFVENASNPKYWACSEKVSKLDASADYTDPCTSYSSKRDRILSKDFDICVARLGNMPKKIIYKNCSESDSLNLISSERFTSCQQSLNGAPLNLTEQIMLCSDDKTIETLSSGPSAKQCVLKGLEAAYRNYLYYSVTDNRVDKNYLYFLNKDCKDIKTTKKQSSGPNYVSLVKDINIHTYEQFQDAEQKESILFGGISSLSFDPQTNELFALSDYNPTVAPLPVKPARMYVFNLTPDLKLEEKRMIFFKDDEGSIAHVDSEGLYRTHSGHFFVSSEYGDDDKGVAKAEKGYNISFFNPLGKWLGYVPVPQNFITQYEEKKIKKEKVSPPPPKPNSNPNNNNNNNNNNGGGDHGITVVQNSLPEGLSFASGEPEDDGRDGSSDGPPSKAIIHPAPVKENSTYIVTIKVTKQGLVQNKSIESLSLSPDEQNMYIANEGPLIQDAKSFVPCAKESKNNNDQNGGSHNGSYNGNGSSNSGKERKCGGSIRLVKYQRRGNSQADRQNENFVFESEYKYDLDNEVDNGVSEILSLKKDVLLVLERSWSEEKKRIVSKIYLVRLNSQLAVAQNTAFSDKDNLTSLNKTLIVNFDDLIPDLSPGFHWLENFEAMTLGPKLSNGNQTLIVATDNNFSSKQRTLMLILELKPEFFQLLESAN